MVRSVRVICRFGAAIVLAFILSGCSNPSSESTQAGPADTTVATNPPPAAPSPHQVVGKAPAAINGIPAIVVLEPTPSREFPAQTSLPIMGQAALAFIPDLLFVRTGQQVGFGNSDETLHNINVKDDATREQAFNVALPGGGTYRHTFTRDGFYDVRCDIHPAMAATIISTSTPYAMVADAQGGFVFEDVARGSYTVTVYAGTQRLTRTIDVTTARTEVIIPGT